MASCWEQRRWPIKLLTWSLRVILWLGLLVLDYGLIQGSTGYWWWGAKDPKLNPPSFFARSSPTVVLMIISGILGVMVFVAAIMLERFRTNLSERIKAVASQRPTEFTERNEPIDQDIERMEHARKGTIPTLWIIMTMLLLVYCAVPPVISEFYDFPEPSGTQFLLTAYLVHPGFICFAVLIICIWEEMMYTFGEDQTEFKTLWNCLIGKPTIV